MYMYVPVLGLRHPWTLDTVHTGGVDRQTFISIHLLDTTDRTSSLYVANVIKKGRREFVYAYENQLYWQTKKRDSAYI